MNKFIFVGVLAALAVVSLCSLVLAPMIIAGPICGLATYRWEQITENAPFAPRDGAALLSFHDNLFLLGGWNSSHDPMTNSEVWSSRDGLRWTRLPDAPWEGRHTFGSVVFDGRMWVLGGDANRGHYQTGIWSSADGIDWTREASAPWAEQGRVLFQTYVHDGYLWVLGGQTLDEFVDDYSDREPIFYSDVWRSRNGRDWEVVSSNNAWAPRGMTVDPITFQGRLQIIGGGTYDTGGNDRLFYNDRWSSADGIDWVQEEELAPWPARQYHATAHFDSRMWVIGGYNDQNLADTWFSCGRGWFAVETPWPARHAAAVAEHKGHIFMIGGPMNESAVWRLSRE